MLRRWRRSTRRERRDLLAQVKPALYPTNLPLVCLAERLIGKTIWEQWKHHSAYLVPYLNIERLSLDWTHLLRLLHHRTSSDPEDWVVFDNARTQLAWDLCCITEKSAHGCVAISGQNSGVWKAFDREVHLGQAYGTPRALLILEVRLYSLQIL